MALGKPSPRSRGSRLHVRGEAVSPYVGKLSPRSRGTHPQRIMTGHKKIRVVRFLPGIKYGDNNCLTQQLKHVQILLREDF